LRFPHLAIASALTLLAACSSSSPPTSCARRPVPAFRLEVTAGEGNLPEGTRVDVTYGGRQTGTYVLGQAGSANEDVCCRPGAHASLPLPHVSCGGDAGPVGSAGSPGAILCELWTDGVAEIRIHATGFPTLDKILPAKVTDPTCGVDTVDVQLTLTRGDGGS
jgi:hypothetical protein